MHQVLADVPNLLRVGTRVARGKSIGFSFNVADRCPVNCKCYWRAMERVPELSPDEMVAFFEQKAREGYIHVNMVGGEPYVHLKSDLLERLAAAMPSVWIKTSGVTPLKHIPNVLHFISIDGADAETHDRVRGFKGLYDRIVGHLSDARARGSFPACLHVTLNSQNYQQVRQILEVWRANGLVDGVAFSTHTPIREANDDWLRLSDEQSESLVEDLLSCKQEFGDFLLNTPAMIRRLLPENMMKQTPDNCPTARFVDSFHADGSKIKQCIFSEKADCSGCGCAVNTALESIMPGRGFDLESAKMLRKLLPPYVQAQELAQLGRG
jgi:MoaA/NifB/PqqE/SkfB family radical SAM enzyme